MKRQFTTRVAWFRAAPPDSSDPLDDTAAIVAALGRSYDVEFFTERRAYDFVWIHSRQPFDAVIYELDNTVASQFIWPYLLHYPGILVARARSVHESRAGALRREHRRDDYVSELLFGGHPLLGAPFAASLLVLVASAAHAETLQGEYPDARIRAVPVCAARPDDDVRRGRVQPARSTARAQTGRLNPAPADDPVTFGVLGGDRLDVVERAMLRARDSGIRAELLAGPPDRVLREADAIIALQWSSARDWEIAAVAAMAAGHAVVVMETEATADWPSLDPQTWQPRDLLGASPVVAVSIDPRDEEHSLVLAIRRLAADAALRAALGAAAREWWRAHASPERAAGAWAAAIEEARGLERPPLPDGWPSHLLADGSGTARDILVQIGIKSDLFA